MADERSHDRTDRRRDDRTYRDRDDEVDADRAWEPAGDAVARESAAGDDEAVYAGGRADDDSWLGTGLGMAMVLAGVLLFLFPEPATSGVGLLLVVGGLVVWIAGAAR